MLHLLLAALLTPSQVLDKAKAAVGVQEPGIYRAEERETQGNATISFVKIAQGENYVQTQHNGDVGESLGRFGGISWTQNANGIVLTHSGPSVVDDPFADALRAPESSNVVHVSSDAGGDVVLEIAPRPGLSERRTYDHETFLLSRIEWDEPRGRFSQTFTNYKRYFGVMVATRVESTGVPAGSNATFDLITLDRVPDGSVSLAIPPSKPVFDLGSRSSLLIPAEFSTAGIVVRVSAAGRELDFILDPGRTESIIDTGVAHQLSLDAHGGLLAYQFGTTVAHAVIDDFTLGELHAQHFVLAMLPFSRQIDPTRSIVGILGADFFASGRVAIDFGAKAVTMLAPTAPLPSQGWGRLPLEVNSGWGPLTRAKFNGVGGTFVVMLGAPQTILYKHYFANFVPDSSSVILGQLYDDSKNDYAYKNYTFSRLGIGDLTFADAVVQVVDHGQWADAVGVDGLLGRTFWQNFSLIFDYAGETLYIKSELPE